MYVVKVKQLSATLFIRFPNVQSSVTYLSIDYVLIN
jgi:hypothetical protein